MTDKPVRGFFATRLRNYFLTGLIICAPLAITAWITWSFILWADSWVKPYLPFDYNPDNFLPYPVPGFGLLTALMLITLVGFFTANLIGRSVVGFGESLLVRTPLVRSIYKGLKQIFQTVLQDQSNSFKKAGLIEYPSPGLWALVFIATDAKGEIAVKFTERGLDMVAVFLPPTPVPTAGFLIFVPREKIVPLDMSPEDAAKLLLSGGLVSPEYLPKTLAVPQQETPAKRGKTLSRP
ncbi:hypothetical protein ASE23_06800 [Rhizobium sp. Root73]|uniref:DUF502 domain-containing protein n=1 Tax=unclassified Rhizobium TaxID=2613769 RepID=UPI00072C4A44|nr:MULTISPECIES: DUF502 domain-containing protein [unclassified Rhizobium]KQY10844.1 hypothetical protein ASD36_09035 [Rhizobium sp. Root1334]KRC04829.1 hypothetical protein ASE23_06800 [Rhizobium sp. Root73]